MDRATIMRAVKSKNTGPELIVRRIVHSLGFRFRLHRQDLPGSPDLAFIGRRKAIFVHGCFWHGHDCPRGARVPKTNSTYWLAKIARNRERDAAAIERLTAIGWQIHIVWECELKDRDKLERRLRSFLEASE
ncbi:very short patch repair endonuclease [Cupriavidus sp. D39]|uniref:very short patch repair endonuclease n=1 Tax=Cupriavidus sp. D39 TaxID=2997877 RepID=UPI00226E4D26|nr:DNA mismatch endonuclease Vsr [Cupriavidus sp. D39]MCY0856855.1 DNA mismatch endonuclease Vsr [Cupriavidus sp. D39]